MKKILSLIIAFLLIFSCFAVTAFAEDIAIGDDSTDNLFEDDYNIFEEEMPIASFSEGYDKFFIDGEAYSRVNGSRFMFDYVYNVLVEDEYNEDYYTGNSVYLDLTDTQKKALKGVDIGRTKTGNAYYIEFYFKDGAILTATFLDDRYIEDYNNLLSGNIKEYIVDLEWPEGNMVSAQREAFSGKELTMTQGQLYECEYFCVNAKNSDGSLEILLGWVFVDGDNYYYLDAAENGTADFWAYSDDGNEIYKTTVYEITDEALLTELSSAMQRYYEDDYGYLYDDNVTDTVSAVFLVFIFAVVPLAVLVISVIKTIRGKGVYKKIYGTIAVLSALELAVFTIIAVILNLSD